MPLWSLLVLSLQMLGARADVTVFDVRRTLRMSDQDQVLRDYYLNGGQESGLAVGMVVTVTRKLPLYDNYQNRSAGDVHLKVAKLKIIHVQKGLSVGRVQSEFSRENAPLLEDPFVMVGDALDLATAVGDRDRDKDKDKERADGRKDAGEEPSSPASEPNVGMGKPMAQISVHETDMSSQAVKSPPAAPPPVDAPTLQ